MQTVNVGAQFRPDHGKLGEGRVLDPTDEGMLGAAEESEDRDQKQQKREQGQEPVEGQQRGQRATPVVTELLPDADHEGQRPDTLLRPVHPAGQLLSDVHQIPVCSGHSRPLEVRRNAATSPCPSAMHSSYPVLHRSTRDYGYGGGW